MSSTTAASSGATATTSGGELSREQLLEYVKKQKIKMKKLETEIQELKSIAAISYVSSPATSSTTKEKIDTNSSQSPSNNTQMEALMIEVQSLEEQLNEKNIEVYRLTKKVHTMEESNSELTKLKEREKELTFQVDSLNLLVNNLKEKLQLSDQKLTDCRDALQESQLFRDNESKRADYNESKVELLEKQIKEMSLESDRLHEESSASAETLGLLNQRIRDLDNTLHATKADQSVILNDSLQKIKDLELKLEQIQSSESDKLDTFLKKDEAMENKIITYVQEIKDLQSVNSTLSSDIHKFNQTIMDRDSRIDLLLSENKELNIQLNNKSTECQDLEIKLSELYKQLELEKESNQRLQNSTNPEIAILSKQLQDAMISNDNILKRMEEKQQQYIQLEEMHKESISWNTSRIQTLSDEITVLKQTNDKNVIDHKMEVNKLIEQINKTVGATESLTKTIIELENQLVVEQTKCRELSQQLDKEKQLLASATEDIRRYKTIENELAESKSSYSSLSSEYAVLEAKLSALESQSQSQNLSAVMREDASKAKVFVSLVQTQPMSTTSLSSPSSSLSSQLSPLPPPPLSNTMESLSSLNKKKKRKGKQNNTTTSNSSTSTITPEPIQPMDTKLRAPSDTESIQTISAEQSGDSDDTDSRFSRDSGEMLNLRILDLEKEMNESQTKLTSMTQEMILKETAYNNTKVELERVNKVLEVTLEELNQIKGLLDVEKTVTVSLRKEIENQTVEYDMKIKESSNKVFEIQKRLEEEIVKYGGMEKELLLREEELDAKVKYIKSIEEHQAKGNDEKIEKLTQEKDNIVDQLQISRNEIIELNHRIETLLQTEQMMIEKKDEELYSLRNELSSAISRVQSLEEEVSLLKLSSDDKEKELITTKSEMTELLTKYEELKSSVAKKQSLLQQASTKAKDLQSQLSIVTDEKIALQGQIDKLNQEMIIHQLPDLQEQLTSSQVYSQSLEQQIIELKTVIEKLQSSLQESKDKMIQSSSEIHRLDEENRSISNLLQSKLNEIHEDKEIHAKLIIEIESWKQKVLEVEMERDTIKQSITSMEISAKESAKYSSKIVILEKLLQSKQQELNEITKKYDELEESFAVESSKCSQQLSSLQSKLDIISQERDTINQERDLLWNQIESMKNSKTSDTTTAIESYVQTQQQLQDQIDRLHTQIESEREEIATKHREEVEALGDKLKRLKLLLARTKNALQEREVEVMGLKQDIEKMASNATKRPQSIKAFLQVAYTLSGSIPSDHDIWILISETIESGSSHSLNTDTMRWVRLKEVQSWLSTGTVLVGTMPHPIDQTYQEQLSQQQAQYEAQSRDLRAELTELQNTFNAYKTRAQTALKRIGVDDQKRQSEELAYTKQIEKLETTIAELRAQIGLSEGKITELIGDLETLSSRHSEVTNELKITTNKIIELEREKEDIRKQLEQSETNRIATEFSLSNTMLRMEELLKEKQSKANIHRTDISDDFLSSLSGVSVQNHVISSGSSGSSDNNSNANNDNDSSSSNSRNVNASSASKMESVDLSTPLRKLFDNSGSMVSDTILESTPRQPSKLMLLQQADLEVKAALASLREENGRLNAEILDLKGLIAVHIEKLSNQADIIADLEASLLREREFNASGRHINADYLVNVLKKFFLSSDTSERAKLVSVICSLLHLRSDEVDAIVEKWSVKTGPLARGGGIVGWLMTPGSNNTPVKPVVSSQTIRGETIRRVPPSGDVSSDH